MQFNVATLLQEPVGSHRMYDIEDGLARRAALGYERHVNGQADLMRTDRGVLVRARLEVVVPLQCARCLRQYQQPLSLDIREEFIPESPLPPSPDPAPEPALDGVEDAFPIDEHHHLDLSEAVRQYEETALPLQPICAADCAGLCSRCGQNLNDGSCDCPPEAADARWSALAGLARQMGTEDGDGASKA